MTRRATTRGNRNELVENMRVIVCGGRTFDDSVVAYRFLDMLHAIHKFQLVIHGASRGADTLADNWAYARHVNVAKFPALWKVHGNRKAGPIRNAQMLSEGSPDLVIAFPGGGGTRDMKRQADAAGVTVIDLDDEQTRADVFAAYRELHSKNSASFTGRCGSTDPAP